MGRIRMAVLVGVPLLWLAGCGATVGDPCTTVDDCGDGLCLNRDYTPGGYCSKQCDLTDRDSCPAGTRCVEHGAARDLHACFLECGSDTECRSGYTCQRLRNEDPFRVCIGQEGF